MALTALQVDQAGSGKTQVAWAGQARRRARPLSRGPQRDLGSEFDLANARWNIPEGRMKGGRKHTVMLSKRAVEIVRELHPDGLKPDEPVFRSHRRGANQMLRLAGYADFTVHGTARATFKTWADEATSFRDAVSEACLAHVSRLPPRQRQLRRLRRNASNMRRS
jgi:integrase